MTDEAQELVPSSGLRQMAATVGVSQNGLAPKSLAELMDFAQLMAKAGPMVGKAFRGQPGACLAITMQAMRWNMDPFAVSQKAYVANEAIAYEAQLVTAVIHAHAPILGKPRYAYTGEGNERRCKVSALMKGDGEPSVYESPPLKTIIGKSPLWQKDPDQQLGYYAIRAWARRYCPEVIMGVYTPDEMADAIDGEAVIVDRSDSQSPPSEPRKSSYQAKKDGDWDAFLKALALVTTEDEKDALANSDAFLEMPRAWRESAQDEIEKHMERLAAQNAGEVSADPQDAPPAETPKPKRKPQQAQAPAD